MYQTSDLFDFSHSLAGSRLAGVRYPWQALHEIKDWILALGAGLDDSYE